MEDFSRSRESLQIVYTELAARISNDNNNSWQIVTLASAMLAVLGTPLFQDPPLQGWSRLCAGIAGLCFIFAVLKALTSLLAVSCLPKFIPRRIFLGKEGRELAKQNEMLFAESEPLSFFHTRAFHQRGVKIDQRRKYLAEISERFEEDLVAYNFFLANLIAIKREPRVVSLYWMFGGIFFLLLLVLHR